VGRRGNRAAGRRSPKNNVWTTVVPVEQSLAVGATTGLNVVVDTDWQRAAGANERATLMRIRGWIDVINKLGAGSFAGGALLAYALLTDEDASNASAADPATYVEEDILWTGGGCFPFSGAGAAGGNVRLPIDIKAMRKMRVGMNVRVVLTNATDNIVSISGVVRGLLRIGGN